MTPTTPESASRTSVRWAAWSLCGAGVVAVAWRVAALSKAFVWGDRSGWADRPIAEFVAWWLVGWLLYAAALRLAMPLAPRLRALGMILLVAVAARAAFFGTNPIQEDDAYRYLWDGQQVLEGVNPYRYAPREVQVAEDPSPDLQKLQKVLEDPAARDNFRKINNTVVPTVYPPLNMAVFAACQKAAPWKLDGLRAAFLLLEIATILLLWFALRAAGANPHWAAVYAWCPMVIKEMSNSPHHDALVGAMLAAFLLAAVCERPRTAALFLALATAAKLYPIALAPVLLAWTWRRDRRAALAAAAVLAATLAALWAPFYEPGIFRGTGTFATEWSSNSGAFDLLARACRRWLPRGDHPMRFLGAQGLRGDIFARIAAGAAAAAWIAWVATRPRFPKPAIARLGRPWDLPFRCFLALALPFAIAPAQHPWYFAGILPFVALFPYRSWVMLTGLLGLYYLKFHFRYHPEMGEEADRFAEVRALEYAPFYAALIWEGVKGWLAWRRVRDGA
ncbi:MAG: DUF2029 domain-containing protein [Planctomycetes bacterium]|nr:DUF2029 domain-containing protein [Planctomycetota bacterium]